MEFRNIDFFQPAPYNPRRISEDKIAELMESLSYVGFGKPIIATASGTIIAGHQRSKAGKQSGLTQLPTFIMDDVSVEDEVRFNQIHNSADIDTDIQVMVPPCNIMGFMKITPHEITGEFLQKGATARSAIHKLYLHYGEFGSCIATADGEVISGQQYALAMKQLHEPLLVFYIPTEKKERAKQLLGQQYGEFYYGNLKKKTYMQGFAQKFRLRREKYSNSILYETLVLPFITKEQSVFDFGAGQMDYVTKLISQGYKISGIEFYFRKKNLLDLKSIRRMFQDMCVKLRKEQFDVVICDSVLNSVDSLTAEADVVNVLYLLLKDGGKAFISGRRMQQVLTRNEMVISRELKRNIEFPDVDGFTGLFRGGEWFYQKLHTDEQVTNLMAKHGFLIETFNITGTGWYLQCTKQPTTQTPEELLASVEREFGLPLPQDQQHQFSAEAIKVFDLYVNPENYV